jgi:hypothetical protein
MHPLFTQPEIEAALAKNEIDQLWSLASGLIDGYYEVDYSVGEAVLRALGRHRINSVRGDAILSLGRLAYQTRRFDAPGVIFHIVVDGLRDPDPTVAQKADMAACCIAYMHGWKFPDRPRRRG